MAHDRDNRERGKRLQHALTLRERRKMMALAVELGVSPAAVSKWKQGGTMSVEHACRIALMLEISLDWLLMGRDTPEWSQRAQIDTEELELLRILRARPTHILAHLIAILSEIPRAPHPPISTSYAT